MNQNQVEAVQVAVRILGSQAALARALGVTPVTVGQWLSPEKSTGRGVPPKQCVRVEKLTVGAVTRRDLRPDDWQEIWPELVEPRTDGQRAALKVPAETAEERFLKLADGLTLTDRRTGPADRRITPQSFTAPDRRVGPADRRGFALPEVAAVLVKGG